MTSRKMTPNDSTNPSLSIEQQIVAATRRIMRAVDIHSKRLVDRFGLTGPQLATLQEVERLDAASPTALARAVHLSQGTVTGILQRLEKRGLIERARSETDGRGVVIRLTGAGATLLTETPSLLQDRFREELRRLEDWERHQILSTLQRIAGLMDAREIDASPHLTSGAVTEAGDGAARPKE